MSIVQMSSIQRMGALLWKDAAKQHNDSLERGATDERFINIEDTGFDDIDVNSLAVAAYQVSNGLREEQGPFGTSIQKILRLLNGHASAINIFTQCNPQMGNLILGSVRKIFQIIEETEKATCIAGEGILQILVHLDRWEQTSKISYLLNSDPVRESIISLYTKILDFLITATLWLERSKISKLRANVFNAKGDEFQQKANRLKEASDLVDKEISTRVLEIFQTMTTDVSRIIENTDRDIAITQRLEEIILGMQNQLSYMAKDTETSKHTLAALPSSISEKLLGKLTETIQLQESKEWLLKGVTAVSPSQPPANGTCEWLPQHPVFSEWLSGLYLRALWIEGLPGRGKTTMANFLRHYLNESGGRTVFYGFRRSGLASQHMINSALLSIMVQILGTSVNMESSVLGPITKLVNRYPLGPQECSFEELLGATQHLLRNERDCILILDALDECLTKDVSSQACARKLVQSLHNAMSLSPGRLAIFSRPEPQFHDMLNSALVIQLSCELLLADIIKFSNLEYNQLGLYAAEKSSTMDHIKFHSQGSFWWAKLFLEHLANAPDLTSFHRRLDHPIPSVEQFYSAALDETALWMDEDLKSCQENIFTITLHARRVLSVLELRDALQLSETRPGDVISRICRPLISIQGDFVQFSHPSAREFIESRQCTGVPLLGHSVSHSHNFIAEICINVLQRKEHAELQAILAYLTRNHDPSKYSADPVTNIGGDLYNYAARYWHVHLCQAERPSYQLIVAVREFLFSLQFTHWCEYSTAALGALIGVTGPLDRLKMWKLSLPSRQRAELDLEYCYKYSYSRLVEACELSMPLHQCLARISLCGHYLNFGLIQEHDHLLDITLSILQKHVPLNHPVVLRNKSTIAFSYLRDGKMQEALDIYSALVPLQKEMFGEQSIQFINAQHYCGESQYFMANYEASLVVFHSTVEGFLNTRGSASWSYLAAKLWYGRSLAQLGDVESALRIWKDCLQKRLEDEGPHDEFAVNIRIGLADLLMFVGRSKEALLLVEESLPVIRASRSLTDISRLDVEILLAKIYHKLGMGDHAWKSVEELERSGCLASQFQRSCQVSHLKGLLLAAGGSYSEAMDTLMGVLIQTEPEQNNLCLLWMRIDLADMIRRKGPDGDKNTAAILFDKIVRDLSQPRGHPVREEPDSPRLLKTAEEALKYTRSKQYAMAKEVLAREEVEWMRPSDLWMWYTEQLVFI
ncbi:unnamed protein product [Clonostachys chloroleuca]|uniref:NACHT domain-containing protein n=1 Tax=Clonostachys chloroleuca TaxID=1926264 RepID=A0AA35M9I6_9HYPO|nr:unnamed protein product [Clonostachys chloroleuca]